MESDRWQKVKKYFEAALKLAPEAREEFLAAVCAGDESLRAEIEELLAAYRDDSFLETPAAGEVADFIAGPGGTRLETGARFSHYEIVRQIGAGGMGEVYLAEDTMLDRRVAIKILNEKFQKSESNLERFLQEAKSASGLNHPNILVIHEIGAEGGTHYIVSEYIEGKTLREVIDENSLTLPEIFEIAIHIANALVAAHAAQIIHRDIKPENVIVRPDGFVKILDFGLAKLVRQKQIGFEASTVRQNQTAKGVILGTVQYMSPEQAKGERVDERTDIFSLGVVFYEMIAGKTPFAGASVSETFANLINTEPPPLARFSANIPNELERIVAKMLRKKADERYQTIKGFLADLKDLRKNPSVGKDTESSQTPNNKNTGSVLQPTGGGDGAPAQTDETNLHFTGQIKRHKPAAALGLIILLMAAIGLGYYFWTARKTSLTDSKSLAVLPFVNAGQDPNAEYLSDGITENIINNLSQLSGLKVMSRNSAFRFKDNQSDTRNIASQLGVESVVTGDVRQLGDKFVINVRLINASDDSQIWGNQYIRSASDIIALQNEIAGDVSRKLGARLSGANERKIAKKYTDNPEAYQLFLRGRYHMEKYTPQDNRRALEYLQQAVALDPNFAAAYAYLSALYENGAGSKYYPRAESVLTAREYVLKALALDDHLSTAHEVYGVLLYQRDFDFVAAEREFKRALELDPNDTSARETYGGFLIPLGRQEEALAEMRQAAEINPLSATLTASIGNSLLNMRRYDEAVAQYKKALELDTYSIGAHMGLGVAYQMQRKYAESVEERAKITEVVVGKAGADFMRESFAKGGWQGFLREMTENPQAPQATPYIKASLYAELGEKDKVFEILNRMYEDRTPGIVLLHVDPRFESVRDDSRYIELMRRIGLSP